MGFVFWPNSKRAVTRAQAAVLKKKLDPKIQAVGVFVEEDPQIIIELLEDHIIDMAQLHGQETEEEIRLIQKASGRPVIKAVLMKSEKDAERWQDTAADFLLLDGGKGNGQTFDWNLIRKIERPFFLAGGLDADNVQKAIELVRPYGVDLSSGAETNGKKDREKIMKIMRSVQDEQR